MPAADCPLRRYPGGSQMPLAAAAIGALDPAHVAEAVRDGGTVGIEVGGREHTLTADDLILTMRAPEGYSVEREGAHAVALDLTIDSELLDEGRAREIVHAVQSARKNAGLDVQDRIELAIGGDEALLRAADRHRGYLSTETLAVDCSWAVEEAGDGVAQSTGDTSARFTHTEQIEVEGLPLMIALRRA